MCHHLVALAQFGHAGAGRCDRSGRLRPERHRSRASDLPAADPAKLVPVADAGGDDVMGLACGWRRRLVHLEELDGLAERSDPGYSAGLRFGHRGRGHGRTRRRVSANLEHDFATLPVARDSLERRPGLCQRKNRVDLRTKLVCVHQRFQLQQLLVVGFDDEVVAPGISSAIVTTRSPAGTSPPRVSKTRSTGPLSTTVRRRVAQAGRRCAQPRPRRL